MPSPEQWSIVGRWPTSQVPGPPVDSAWSRSPAVVPLRAESMLGVLFQDAKRVHALEMALGEGPWSPRRGMREG